MKTRKEELVEKTKAKIIEIFGPESALAQAMEDDGFFDKLGSLIAWLYGEIMLSQPRPEPPRFPKVEPKHPWTGTGKWIRATSTTADTFTTRVTSAVAKWADNYRGKHDGVEYL